MYQHQVTFVEAIQMALTTNYCKFTGRSSRSEYWWFALFSILASIALSFVEFISPILGQIVNIVFALAMLLPSLGLLVRRFHDIGRSGWWVLGLCIAGIIGVAMIVAGILTAMDFSISSFLFTSKDVNITLIAIGFIIAIATEILSLVWCCMPSQSTANEWGEVPNLVN